MATTDDIKAIAANLEATFQSLRRTAANLTGLLAVGRATCDEIKAYNLWALAVYNTQRGILTSLRAAGEVGVPELPTLPTLFAWKGISGADALRIDCNLEQQGLTGVLRDAMASDRPPVYLSTTQINILTQGSLLPDAAQLPSLSQLSALGVVPIIWIVIAGLAVTVSLTLGIAALARYLTEQSIQRETTERTQIQAVAFERYTSARMSCYADCTGRGNTAQACADACAKLVDKPNLKIDPARASGGASVLTTVGLIALAAGGGAVLWKVYKGREHSAMAGARVRRGRRQHALSGLTRKPEIGGTVRYGGDKWVVVDVHGYPVQKVDLRRTIIVNPKKRYLDEAESRRNISVDRLDDV